ncbi:MAG: hypothetical protein ABS920_15020, partial [Sporosarcina sp.]
MKTQAISVLILSILCVAALIFSASIWNEKVRNAGGGNEDTQGSLVGDDKPGKKAAAVQMSADDIRKLGASLDEGTLEVILSRAETGEHVQMLIVGSGAITNAAQLFAREIDKTYEELIDITIVTFDMTSTRFVEEELNAG